MGKDEKGTNTEEIGTTCKRGWTRKKL